MCTHSGTICPSFYGSSVRHQVLHDVTRHFNRLFGSLLGFEHRRVIHQKNFQEKLYHISHTYFLVGVPLKALFQVVGITIFLVVYMLCAVLFCDVQCQPGSSISLIRRHCQSFLFGLPVTSCSRAEVPPPSFCLERTTIRLCRSSCIVLLGIF